MDAKALLEKYRDTLPQREDLSILTHRSLVHNNSPVHDSIHDNKNGMPPSFSGVGMAVGVPTSVIAPLGNTSHSTLEVFTLQTHGLIWEHIQQIDIGHTREIINDKLVSFIRGKMCFSSDNTQANITLTRNEWASCEVRGVDYERFEYMYMCKRWCIPIVCSGRSLLDPQQTHHPPLIWGHLAGGRWGGGWCGRVGCVGMPIGPNRH